MQIFTLNQQYVDWIVRTGIPVAGRTDRQELSADEAGQQAVGLTASEYLALFEELGEVSASGSAAVELATSQPPSMYAPPLFAAYCAHDATVCVERLGHYGKLCAPVSFLGRQEREAFHIELLPMSPENQLPGFLVEVAMVFVVEMIRCATQKPIVPQRVTMAHDVDNKALGKFMGCPVERGARNVVMLSLSDAHEPFASENEEMWLYLEPELKRRLAEVVEEHAITARVKDIMIEIIPHGDCRLGTVAKQLCMSTRTLQRKLRQENTSFQQVLADTRQYLALRYIEEGGLTNNDIAYLLGYQDTSAFLRAFIAWTGMTVKEYKRQQSAQ